MSITKWPSIGLSILACASLGSASLLLVLQRLPKLQRAHFVLASAATLVPMGLFGWLFGGGALAGLLSGHRRNVAVASVAMLSLVHASGLSNRFGGTRSASGRTQLGAVMLNAEYGQADMGVLAAKVTESDADVLVILEYHVRAERALDTLEHRYPHRVGRATQGADGTVILSRTPLEQVAEVSAIFQNYVVKTTVRGVPWTIAAVHPFPPIRSADEWVEDSRNVANMVRPYLDDNLLVIGDFNATQDQVTMRDFTDLGLRNVARETGAGWQPTWPMEYPVPPFAALDHALIGPRVQAHRLDTFVVPGTDHKGLDVTVSA